MNTAGMNTRHPDDGYVPRKFIEHSRVEVSGIEISVCTRRHDYSRAIWVGPDGFNGCWVDADQSRDIAHALIEAADLCDAFEAELTLKEERETARLNAGPIAGPVAGADTIVRIELAGGVIAFEDADEVGA